MRWWMVCVSAMVTVALAGCGRVQRGEVQVSQVPMAPVKRAKPPKETKTAETKEPPKSETATKTPEQPAPAKEAPPSPRTPLAPEGVATPTQTPPLGATPTLAKPEPVPTPSEGVPLTFADEARGVRASADTLYGQFDKLPVSEIRTRLLLLNQALSELEVRSPALVLWRTALRLEVLSKAPYPDVAVARAWLSRARTFLAEQKVGLTALEKAEAALRTSDLKSAITALRDAAVRLNAPEQADALTQARLSVLNALEAVERQKPGVAKAEVGETVKTLDRLLILVP